MDLESAARELKLLAKREKLSPPELDRAKSLMVELKRMGMTNPELVELTEHRWEGSTMKGYTKGAEAIDPEPWRSTAALFSEMLSMDMSLAQVKQAMTINREFGDAGTSTGEITSFTRELKEEGIDISAFADLFRGWRRSGLKPTDAASALKYKAELEGIGFDIGSLCHLAEAARQLGDPRHVIDAVAKYHNSTELDSELTAKQGQVEALDNQIKAQDAELEATGQSLKELQGEAANLEKALTTYERLAALGFDERALEELSKASDRYGAPSDVLAAINFFKDLSDIKAAYEATQAEVEKETAKLERLEARYSHLKSAIDMCQKLLRDHQFGLDAISTILSTAQRYGEPMEVLKAVEAYGKLEAANKKIEQRELETVKIESKIEQLKKMQTQHEAKIKATLDQYEALNAKAIELGRAMGSVEEQLRKDSRARDILNFLQNPTSAVYEDHAPLILVLAMSILSWVSVHKDKLRYTYRINEGLEDLIKQLGGG